jgi:callose synthase
MYHLRLFGTAICSGRLEPCNGGFAGAVDPCYSCGNVAWNSTSQDLPWSVFRNDRRLADRNLCQRPEHALLSRNRWIRRLGRSAFFNTVSLIRSGGRIRRIFRLFVVSSMRARAQNRWNNKAIVTLATIVEVGGISASLVLKPTAGLIMDVARGYPYYPNNTDLDMGLGLERHLVVGLVWLAGSVLVAATIVYRDGHFGRVNLVSMLRHGYAAVPTTDNGDSSNKRPTPLPPHKETLAGLDAFNMFDPADLPPRLAEYANMVYSACEDLGNFFGFQDSSVRNQAEHLLILLSNNRRYMSSHILPPSVQPPSPIHALHAKVFSNYVKWCRAMGVPPHFSKMNASMSAPPAVASRVVDLVLYFCIWGEGSNLRHMPECTWFLYHKMMEEYIKSEGYTQTRSLYAGHFLDHVVEPIYDIVATVSTSTCFLINTFWQQLSNNLFLLSPRA